MIAADVGNYKKLYIEIFTTRRILYPDKVIYIPWLYWSECKNVVEYEKLKTFVYLISIKNGVYFETELIFFRYFGLKFLFLCDITAMWYVKYQNNI